MKNKTLYVCTAAFLSVGVIGSAFAEPPGKATSGEHPHKPVAAPAVDCQPKAGTEGMKHDPKDHPMPQTRGMQGMDPAQHMTDCQPSVKSAAPTKPNHDHSEMKK